MDFNSLVVVIVDGKVQPGFVAVIDVEPIDPDQYGRVPGWMQYLITVKDGEGKEHRIMATSYRKPATVGAAWEISTKKPISSTY